MNEIPMTDDEKQKVQMLREMVEYKIGIPEVLKILREAKGNENAALDEILSIASGELNQSRQISAPSPVHVSPVVNPPPVADQKDLELELMRLKLEEQKNEERRREEELRRKLEREEEERKERQQLEAIKQRIEEEQKRKEELEFQRQLLEEERRRVEREKMELELIRQRDELFKREEEKRKQEEMLKKQEDERLKLLRIKEEEEAAEFIRQAALKKKEEEERVALLRIKEEEERAAAEEKERQMKLAELEKMETPKQVEDVVSNNSNNNNDNKAKDDSLAFIREEELTRSRMGMFNLEPIVLIYFRPAQDNCLVNPRAQAKNLTEIFTNLGVQPFGIQVADISTDFELGSYLKSCFPEEPNLFPFICIHRKPVGNYLKIKQLQNDGTLMTYVNSPELIPELHRETFSYRQDVLDKALDAAEFLITNTLYLPYSILTWPFGGKAKDSNLANARNTDIPVVHHNWYSRGTKRLLRFSSESISRIHPSYPDQIRAEHKYADVENVSFPSEKYDFVIKYLDGVADYYTCTKADLEIVKEIVRTKCKENANFTNF